MLKQRFKQVIAILIMISLVVQMPQVTKAETSNNLGNIVRDVTVTLNGKLLSDITTPIEITDTTIINLSYKWAISDSVTVENGDYAEISIPNVFTPIKDITGILTDPLDSDVTVGTFTLKQSTKILRLDFNDGLKDRDGKNGTLNFSMKFDVTAFEDNVTQIVHFEELVTKDFAVSVKPKVVLPSMSKTGAEDADLNANSINWTIDVNTSLDNVGNAKITDIIPDGLKLVASSVVINKLNVGYTGAKSLGDVVTDFTINSSTNNLSVDFDAINTAYRISYTTTITDLTKTSFENLATYYDNTTVLQSKKATVSISRGELLEKTGTQNGNSISWCIDVNKEGNTLTNAIIKDTLPNGFSIDSSSAQIYRLTKSGTSWTETDVTSSFSGAVNGTEFNLGNIGKNAYRIKYNTDIIYNKEYQQTEDFTNKAELYEGTTLMDSRNCTVTVVRDSVLEKSGVPSISYTKKEITWTVTVNKANHFIGNAVLKDTLGEGLKLIKDSVKIYNKNGTQILPANYATNHITVVAGDSLEVGFGDINTKYIVTYRTTITDYNKGLFTNTATLSGSGLGTGPGISYSSTVKPNIADEFSKNQVLNKTLNHIYYDGVNYENKTLSWAVPIKPIKNKITGLTMTDTYPNNGMYFLEDSLQITRGGSETLLKKGTDYTITPIKTGYQYGFIITFNTALQGDYYMLYYKTSFDPNLSDIIPNIYQKYENSVRFVGKGETLDEKKTISDIDVTKTSMYIVNNSAFYTGDKIGNLYKIPDRKITWKVHTNYLSQKYTSLTIKDTYGSGQELVEDSIVIKEYSVNANGTVTEKEENLILNQDYTITSTPTDKSFSVTFLKGSNKPYVIMYDTLVTGLSKQTYDNKVVVTTNNEPQTYSSTVKDPDYNVFLTKSAANVEDNLVYTDDALAWKLTVNKSCSPLSNAVLTDVVSSGLEVDESSLKVYQATSTGENGAEVASSEYTYAIEALHDGTTQLKITFIGNITTQYNIEYDTVVVAETGTISNTANFKADEINTVTVPKVTYTATQTTSGTGTGLYRGSLTITKKDGDTGKPLDAGFQLYYILNGKKKIMCGDTKQTTNGVLVYTNLSYRTYYLEEVTPPLGYEASEIKTIEISATNKAVTCEVLNYEIKETPTLEPTVAPTVEPTVAPTIAPTVEPTVVPSLEPTVEPTVAPSVEPTLAPTVVPTIEPTVAPTVKPTVVPSLEPTVKPTVEPTVVPSLEPTVAPSVEPTLAPTVVPSLEPTVAPSVEPTKKPNVTVKPPSTNPVQENTAKDIPKQGKIDVEENSTVAISKIPENGTVTVDASGNWKYTPNDSYVGKDNFVVTIINSDGTESEIYIDIEVDDVPLAGVDDYVTSNEVAKGSVTELPKTGCNKNGIYYLFGIFFTAFGLFYTKRRRTNQKM